MGPHRAQEDKDTVYEVLHVIVSTFFIPSCTSVGTVCAFVVFFSSPLSSFTFNHTHKDITAIKPLTITTIGNIHRYPFLAIST